MSDESERKRRMEAVDAELHRLRAEGELRQQRIAACRKELASLNAGADERPFRSSPLPRLH